MGRCGGELGGARPGRRVLVAGIGNVFLGDDGFGVALAGRLAQRRLPAGVDVVDFGIRGMDLAYALPDEDEKSVPDAHGMDPVKVLALTRALGGLPPRTLVVGCEPQTRMSLDDEEIVAGLTAPVQAALDEAVRLVQELLAQITTEEVRP